MKFIRAVLFYTPLNAAYYGVKMEIWQITVIIAAIIITFLILLFSLAAVVYNYAFGRRYGKNPLLKYFGAEDFALTVKPVSVNADKTLLRGNIYRRHNVADNGKLIIFCHGLGAGQAEYTTEIDRFCRAGFTVLALDNAGCGMSEGKSIRGMYSGVKAAVAAYDYAKTDADLADKDAYFVGHSWGGYSALCASNERGVKAAVSISAPDRPARALKDSASRIIPRAIAGLLYPFWCLIDFFKFGKNANKSAARCAENNGVPTLLIHGGKDNTVLMRNAAFYRAQGGNIVKILDENKAHNPYNTVEAEQKLAELSSSFVKMKKLPREELLAYLEKFDFCAATEEDEKIMEEIVRFIESN